jgi:hypothetical protein
MATSMNGNAAPTARPMATAGNIFRARLLIGMTLNEGAENVFPSAHPAVNHLEYQGSDNYQDSRGQGWHSFSRKRTTSRQT